MTEINLPWVVDEVTAAFRRYEEALCANDVATLNRLFWDSGFTVRYGSGEQLYGFDAIAAFRATREPPGARLLQHTIITSYGNDCATACTEFQRPGFGEAFPRKIGRQTQTWLRTPAGWKVVAAHVSIVEQR
jgi:hypothetical protein